MPLWPLPDVLPVPEPGPRPRRFRSLLLPGAGERLWRPILSVATVLFLDGHHLNEVAHLLELSTKGGGILLDHLGLVVPEADGLQRPIHPPRVSDAAPDLLDPDLARGQLVLAGLLRPLGRVPDECPRHLHNLLRLRARPVTELARVDPTLASDLIHRRQLRQTVHRRTHHVVRVG